MNKIATQPGTSADSEANGHNGDESDPNPFDTAEGRQRREADAEAATVTEKRLQHWAHCQFAVESLPRSQRWARKVWSEIDSYNARRDPVHYPPMLMFNGDRAVKAGATDDQLTALPKLKSEDIIEVSMRQAVEHEAARVQIRAVARELEAARAAAGIPIPGRVNLAQFVPEDTRWVVDQVLARGAVLGLFAERKAGKTTTVVDLVRSVLGGDKFLGRFAVSLPADAEVVLFDTEMTLSSLHRQYQRAGVEHLDRLNLRPLRGRERSLDVRNEAVRNRWREQIAPGSLIAVDCLYSLFGALGVSENSDEVVSVLAGLRSLATECDAAGLVVVHHLGKDPDKGARGHSSLEGFPDAIARIELDGPPTAETPRVFSAYGRDVSIDAGVLTLGDDHRLTIGGNPRVERITAAHHADDEATWHLIDKHPGLSMRGLANLPVEARGKLSRDRIREAVERLALINRIVNKGTLAAPEWHAVERVDPCLMIAGTEV